jgi:gas vesicle protein
LSDGRCSDGFLPGLIFGAIAGAAVALLTTPRSGRETRELLRTRFPDASDEAEDIVERVTGGIRQRIESSREAFREGKEETRARMTEEFDEASRRGSPPR